MSCILSIFTNPSILSYLHNPTNPYELVLAPPLLLAAAFSAASLALLSAVTGSPRPGGGSQVTVPSLAAWRRFL